MKPVIAVTMGDPAGIGAEVIVKAAVQKNVQQKTRLLVVGDIPALAEACRFTGTSLELRDVSDEFTKGQVPEGCVNTLDVLDLHQLPAGAIKYGEVRKEYGQAAYHYLELAASLAMQGQVAGLVTGPINKEALSLAGCQHAGHTEILTAMARAERTCMMLVAEGLRVTHVTTHIPLQQVSSRITSERVLQVVELTATALHSLGFSKPSIAVAGLNPHAGEHGLFGNEEERIGSAVETALQRGLHVVGPLPPDTVFVRALSGEFQAVVAMYHDQGHIPVKMLGFRAQQDSPGLSTAAGVNVTLGLPYIRTSVDHGTAFNIAGKGQASANSMVDAILLAAQMAARRPV